MAHQIQLYQITENERLVFGDNVYARSFLARQLNIHSDGECKVLGAVLFAGKDGINRPALKETIQSHKHAHRRQWRLVEVLKRCSDRDIPVKVTKHFGFVVFKDRFIVSFCTYDLAGTPSFQIHDADEHASICVRG